MKSSVTVEQVYDIYRAAGVICCMDGIVDVTAQCNEQADEHYNGFDGKPLPPKSAQEWAEFFAMQDCEEQSKDFNV